MAESRKEQETLKNVDMHGEEDREEGKDNTPEKKRREKELQEKRERKEREGWKEDERESETCTALKSRKWENT